MDKISIIVPVYNSEKYLAQCLASLQNQTYSNIEVIMIDDGSKDGSASICQSFASDDKRFRYFYQENRGVSAARNHGLDIANGEYIGFCDSDDWVETDMYEVLVALLETNNADSAVVHFFTNDNTEAFSSREFAVYSYGGKEAVLQLHSNRLSTALWNKLFRRNLFENVRFDEEITNREDMLAVWELFIQADKVVYFDVPKYHYFIRSQSLSSEIKESYWTYRKAVYAMKSKMEKTMPENIAYAQRTIVLCACYSLENLIRTNKLQDRHYKFLRNDIVTQYKKDVRKLLSLKERIMINALSCGKCVSILFVKGMILKRRIRGILRIDGCNEKVKKEHK